MSNKLIPNTFQHPNIYIDQLAYFLTPQEQVVLNKAIREILGWHDKIETRRARIALSVFVEGKVSAEGQRLCYGCGLGDTAVRKALDGLHKYRILIKTEDVSTNGRMLELQADYDMIDWDGLRKRREEWDEENTKRTSKARSKKDTATQEEVLCDNRGGVLCDNRGGVLSDNEKETHLLETQETTTPSGVGEKEPLTFPDPPPRERRTPEEHRLGVLRAIAEFEERHALGGEQPIDPTWAKLPAYQGIICTAFYNLSGLSPPKTGNLREQSAYGAEMLYQEIGSAREVVRRMGEFYRRRHDGDENCQFTITGTMSLLKTLVAWNGQTDPRRVQVRGL